MTKNPKQEHYQDGDIFIFIMAAVLFFALLIILMPYVESDAATIKRSYFFDTKPVIEKYNYDSEKFTDLWKSNPKSEYNVKLLTLQNYIWQFLTDEMGLSDECAAGIFGNMMVECGGRSFNLQPYVYSPGGYYYGLCQWGTTGHHYSIAGGSLEEQLQYLDDTILMEMGERAYQSFCSSETPEQAANIFGQWYERCREPYGRQNEARLAYERYSSNQNR